LDHRETVDSRGAAFLPASEDTMDRDALTRSFQQDGFLCLRGFLGPEEMARMDADLDRFVREIVPTMPRADAMFEDYDDPTTLKQITCLDRFDPEFDRLREDRRFVELAELLLDGPVRAQNVEAFIKPPHRGRPTPPHQDGFYFCLSPNEALTFWISLDDIDEENGALCYVRGSHRHGVLPHGASNVLGFSQGIEGGYREALGELIKCPVRRGDCLVHHSLTIHLAPANPTGRRRRAVGVVFFSERARFDEEARQRYKESLERQRAALGVV
jgi:phytanoyl-CoA hydroxylase